MNRLVQLTNKTNTFVCVFLYGVLASSFAVCAESNQKPSVAITEPIKNITLTQGEPYAIIATASDKSGISKVEFYYDQDKLLQVITAPPYQTTGTTENITSGRYTITAKAYNYQGAVATSNPITIRVVPKVYEVKGFIVPPEYKSNIQTLDEYVSRYLDGYGEKSPIFNSHYDWQSSIHGHLAKVLAFESQNDMDGLKAFVASRYTPSNIQGEMRRNTNDPFGWTWLLQLDTRLKLNGISTLTPLAQHFAKRLWKQSQIVAASSGANNDTNWWLASLYQWSVNNKDIRFANQIKKRFEETQKTSSINRNTAITDGDTLSSVSISSYAHAVMAISDTERYQDGHDVMLDAFNEGILVNYLVDQTDLIQKGRGFENSSGKAISLAYGYWALFKQTKNSVFYHAYQQVMEFNMTNAAKIGEQIVAGHWLPNLASFGAGLPSYLVVSDLDGAIQVDIDSWNE
jgi:hypothetical protein